MSVVDDSLEIESDNEFAKRKGKLKRQRNLKQYKDLSDEEFERTITEKALGFEVSGEFEKRIQSKLAEFDQDYDLSDLKINDRDTLRALVQAHISLEDYEQYLFKVRVGGIDNSTIQLTKDIQKVMSDLRSDISRLQEDLNIKRKVRKQDQEVSLQAYLDSLKEKARAFYESKMSYIFCEKCNVLLATLWTLYPTDDRNKIALVCHNKSDGEHECGHKTIIDTKTLLNNSGTNNKKITPESML